MDWWQLIHCLMSTWTLALGNDDEQSFCDHSPTKSVTTWEAWLNSSCFYFYVSTSMTTSVKVLNIFQSHHPTVCFFFLLLHQPGIASQVDAVWVPFYTPERYVCLTWSEARCILTLTQHPVSWLSYLPSFFLFALVTSSVFSVFLPSLHILFHVHLQKLFGVGRGGLTRN